MFREEIAESHSFIIGTYLYIEPITGVVFLGETKGAGPVMIAYTATLTVKRIRGVRRAALAPVIPNGGRGVMLIDCGANVECTSEYLLQFAFMAASTPSTYLAARIPG